MGGLFLGRINRGQERGPGKKEFVPRISGPDWAQKLLWGGPRLDGYSVADFPGFSGPRAGGNPGVFPRDKLAELREREFRQKPTVGPPGSPKR